MIPLPNDWTVGDVVENEDSAPRDSSPTLHVFIGYCLEDDRYHWFFVPKDTPPRAIIYYFVVGDPERGMRGEAASRKTERFADTIAEIYSIARFRVTKAAPFECEIAFEIRLNMGLLEDIYLVFEDQYDDKSDAGLVDYIISGDGIHAVLNENRIRFRWEWELL